MVKRKFSCVVAVILLFTLVFTSALPAAAAQNDTAAHVTEYNNRANIIDRIANIFIRIVLMIRGSKALFSDEETAEEYLAELAEMPLSFTFPDIKLDSEVAESDYDTMVCYNFTPEDGVTNNKKVIYLPGGAFAREPTKQHISLIDDLTTNTGAEVIMVDYPKTPIYTYEETFARLLELYNDLLVDTAPEDIIIMGDSSGGCISVIFSAYLTQLGLPQPAKLILYSPLLDMNCDNSEIEDIEPFDPMLGTDGLYLFAESWLGDEPLDSPEANPMCCDLTNLPETLIFTGTTDILNPDAHLFAEKAAQAGAEITLYEYEAMYHCYVLYPQIAATQTKDISIQAITEDIG